VEGELHGWVGGACTEPEAALASGAGYVGLVASAKRVGSVTAELRERGVDEESLARVRSPAGLDLGPSSQEEIAVAILAELVAWQHARPSEPSNSLLLGTAVDRVCGMRRVNPSP
jgi:xanthine/CO dehydrogenase XdhC/CoxF family maturation factor